MNITKPAMLYKFNLIIYANPKPKGSITNVGLRLTLNIDSIYISQFIQKYGCDYTNNNYKNMLIIVN